MATYTDQDIKMNSILGTDTFNCCICGITFHVDFMSSEIQVCKACKKKEVVKLDNNNRVFCVNYISGKDMSDAAKYGTMIPLTEGNVDVFNLDRLKWTLEDVLNKHSFDPDKDYILLSGGLPINFSIGMICAKYKKINLLLWDAKRRLYVHKIFNI
jgi:hypothetical protein